jgi:hypothetical protein
MRLFGIPRAATRAAQTFHNGDQFFKRGVFGFHGESSLSLTGLFFSECHKAVDRIHRIFTVT